MTIYKVKAGDGKGYSQSFFKGALREGRSATIANWRQTGLNLVINVNKIDTHVSPGYADVEIAFGPPTPNPTPIPTMRLSRRPTGSPSKRPTDQPTSSPSNEPTNEPTRSPTEEPTEVSNIILGLFISHFWTALLKYFLLIPLAETYNEANGVADIGSDTFTKQEAYGCESCTVYFFV